MTDQLNHQLFEIEGKKLVNIKFSPGDGEGITEPEFRDAIAAKIFEIDNGLASTQEAFGDRDATTVVWKDVIERLK